MRNKDLTKRTNVQKMSQNVIVHTVQIKSIATMCVVACDDNFQ